MRTRPYPEVPYRPPGLTDAEADEIRKGVESGLRGPIVIKWIRQLVDDRDEAPGAAQVRAAEGDGADAEVGEVLPTR